jgi:hypothetical protein
MVGSLDLRWCLRRPSQPTCRCPRGIVLSNFPTTCRCRGLWGWMRRRVYSGCAYPFRLDWAEPNAPTFQCDLCVLIFSHLSETTGIFPGLFFVVCISCTVGMRIVESTRQEFVVTIGCPLASNYEPEDAYISTSPGVGLARITIQTRVVSQRSKVSCLGRIHSGMGQLSLASSFWCL